MNKYVWAEYMQQLDQQAADFRRQLRADFQSLRTVHTVFDDVAEESAQLLAELKGEASQSKGKQPRILEATLIDDDDSGEDDW
jgi:ABC-type transporter Mla subunit MlaD